MARYVEDLGLVLPIISGPDSHDPSVISMPFGDWEAVTLEGLRMAIFTEFRGASATQETIATVRAAATALAKGGAAIEEATPPRIEESLAITRAYWQRVESYSWNEWRPDKPKHSLTADEIERSIFAWDRLRRAFLGFMEGYDAIVCPVAGQGAAGYDEFIYTLPFSLTGYPCVAVRAGTSPDGLPIGVQVVARPWRDDVALAIACELERTRGGWQPPPEGFTAG